MKEYKEKIYNVNVSNKTTLNKYKNQKKKTIKFNEIKKYGVGASLIKEKLSLNLILSGSDFDGDIAFSPYVSSNYFYNTKRSICIFGQYKYSICIPFHFIGDYSNVSWKNIKRVSCSNKGIILTSRKERQIAWYKKLAQIKFKINSICKNNKTIRQIVTQQ